MAPRRRFVPRMGEKPVRASGGLPAACTHNYAKLSRELRYCPNAGVEL